MADLEDVTLDGRPLQSLRVADLKAALEERGLSKSGHKNALIKRLKGALMLENLQRTSTAHVGLQPNSQIGEEMSQNSFIKQYLAKQQELLRQRLEREAREAYEPNEQDDHTEVNNSTSYPPQAQDVTPVVADQHKPPGPSDGEGLFAAQNEGQGNRNQETDMSGPPASGSVTMRGGEQRPEKGASSSNFPADSDDDDSEDGEEDGDDDDWDSNIRRGGLREPARGPTTRERSGASCPPQQQHIPSLLSPQLRQPTPPPSPPPELSFPLPDTPKQSPPSPDVAPARRSPSSSSSGSSSSGSRSSSPEPERSGHAERKPGPLTLLARKMESEGAFSGAGWHGGDGKSDRRDISLPSATSFPGRGPPEGLVSAITHTGNTAGHVPFPMIPGTNQVFTGTHSSHIQVPVSLLKVPATEERDRERESEIEREKALELERQEKHRKLEQERAMQEEQKRVLEREKRERALEQERFERQQAVERMEQEKALQREKELALERERQEREQALAKEREEREQALARERALELQRQKELERQRVLEQERLEREREEREKREREEMERAMELERLKALEREQEEMEKALEKERLERERALEAERKEKERIEREKALEQERLERERIERERALEQERIERERVLEQERIERERALEQERLERERALERERIEKEKALERERIEKALEQERLERERVLEQERLERERVLEQERLERERAQEEERLQRERALEQERLEMEQAKEYERLERERALEQERLERERAQEQERLERVLEQERLERERAQEHERKEREKIERENILEQERIAREKALEREREEKRAREAALEHERVEKERAEKERKERLEREKAMQQQKLEREKALESERERALEKEREKALEQERLDKEEAKEKEEQERVLEQEQERVRVTEKEWESHLPPSKRGREIGLTLPTPPPLSTGPGRKSSTEAGEQEDAHAAMAQSEARAAESSALISPTQSSCKKFRFLRDPPVQSQSSSTSMVIKRPRTFSDSPEPRASPMSSPTGIGEQHQEGQLFSANQEHHTRQEVVAKPFGSVGSQSEDNTAVNTTKSWGSKEGNTNLFLENRERDDSVMMQQAAKKSAKEDLAKGKGRSSPLGIPEWGRRDAKKEEKKTRERSSSNDSSSDLDSGSSSSGSSGSSTSSPEKTSSTSRGRRERKPQRTSSPHHRVSAEVQAEGIKETPKASADEGSRTKKAFIDAQMPEERHRKRKDSDGGEEKDKQRQVIDSAMSEPEKLLDTSEETPKAFAARKISISSSKSSPGTGSTEAEQESVAAAGRKRRWGSSTAVTAKKPSISITTDSLKSLIPDIRPAVGQEAVVDLHPEEAILSGAEDEDRERSDQDLQIRRTVTQVVHLESQENGQKEGKRSRCEEEEEEEEEEDVQADMESKKARVEKLDTSFPAAMEMPSPSHTSQDVEVNTVTPSETLIRRSISQQKTGVSITIDDPVRTARQPSPPRGKVSNIVHVCNLVRPFTLGQLKELLSRTGTLVEDGFWIDKIKSHCYVTYSSSEEAVATRAALHGVKWPQSNPKVLSVDFCQQEELDFHKGLGAADRPGAEEQWPGTGRGRAAGLPSLLPERDQWAEREREMERREKARAEREWDRDKVKEFGKHGEGEGGPRRSRSRERRRKERGKSKEKKTEKKEKTAEDPPAKLLDDLFRKTKAAPCIYWLPLTEEQFVQREAARAERMKEREKRMKEQEEEEKKREEERKERMKGGGSTTGERSEGEKDRDRGRDRDRDRGRDRERENDKRRDGYRRPGASGAGGGRRSRSRSDPRERRR
ncbi:uncharacterized protein acin1a isoform 2-T2 [Aulostomus maculatus]